MSSKHCQERLDRDLKQVEIAAKRANHFLLLKRMYEYAASSMDNHGPNPPPTASNL